MLFFFKKKSRVEMLYEICFLFLNGKTRNRMVIGEKKDGIILDLVDMKDVKSCIRIFEAVKVSCYHQKGTYNFAGIQEA